MLDDGNSLTISYGGSQSEPRVRLAPSSARLGIQPGDRVSLCDWLIPRAATVKLVAWEHGWPSALTVLRDGDTMPVTVSDERVFHERYRWIWIGSKVDVPQQSPTGRTLRLINGGRADG